MGLIFKTKILLVEDSHGFSDAVQIKLRKKGYKVITARSFEEAVEQLNKNLDVSVVWLDHYLLGEKTGLDVLKYIKSKEELGKVFICIVSSTNKEIQDTYTKLGVSKYYDKGKYKLEDIVKEFKHNLITHDIEHKN